MLQFLGRFLACTLALSLLGGCGGGDSTVTTITGGGLNALRASPAVSLPFVQQDNNLRVTVESGPGTTFSFSPNANILYATVTVCSPGDPGKCQTIDHIQVDTGSVGLRVLASKVSELNLPAVFLDEAKTAQSWECYPFVIGGLWGANAVADVGMGQQWATALPIQLIQDDPAATVNPPKDCVDASGEVLNTASALGSNGILGIGSVTLDCGMVCQSGNYAGSFVQYYNCPLGAANESACAATAIPAPLQVFNPVAALKAHNNGVVLVLPSVTGLGASTVSGELIFGINTQANNQLAAGASRIRLGVDWQAHPDSYLNVTTVYKGQTVYNSYLDTGTNGLFFTDNSANPITRCQGSNWYCPLDLPVQTAIISHGDSRLPLDQIEVAFHVGNANALFATTNAAFGDLAGAPPVKAASGASSFSWGLPFFYGKRVYASIWQQAGAIDGPWYSWTSL